MPPDEGDALYDAASPRRRRPGLPLLEVGSYCGRSTIWLGAAARACDTVVFAVDHHRGSEENQAGWEHHDPTSSIPRIGKMDTLPFFRAADPRRRARGLVIASSADRRPCRRLEHAARRSCSSTAATARSRPGSTTRVDAARRRRRHAGDPRRVPRPGRRRSPAVRADLPAGDRSRAGSSWCRRPDRYACCVASTDGRRVAPGGPVSGLGEGDSRAGPRGP